MSFAADSAAQQAPMIGRLCVIGVGLIGGSLVEALRERGLVGEVVGCARRAETLATAEYLGLIDRGETDPAAAIAGADVVVIAVPMGQYRALFDTLAPVWPEQAIVTDCGSTKTSVHADLEAALGRLPSNFVAGHPVAGTERSGPAAALPGLFRHRRVILTPHAQAAADATARVRALWEAVGAAVSSMSDRHHDEVLALTSHLPHVVAAALASLLSEELRPFAATGFRDTTRIAAGDPDLWVSILLSNAGAIAGSLDEFSRQFDEFREAVRNLDSERLKSLLQLAKTSRDAL